MSGAEEVVVGGVRLATIGGVDSLVWSHTADGGCEQATWAMDLLPTFTHPALVSGAVVLVQIGPCVLWQGVLSEPDRSTDGWSFSAAGLVADLRDCLSLDNVGDASSTPDVVIDRAIADGAFKGTRPMSLSNTAFTTLDDSVPPARIGDLLDGWANSVTKRWGVDADGHVYATTDPTTPTLHLMAGAGKIGLADDDYASDLYGQYMSAFGVFSLAHASDPVASAAHRREESVDLTNLGIIDGTKAAAVLTGILAKGKARYAWTQSVTVSSDQLTTPGGQSAFLPFQNAQGSMARMYGVIDEQNTPLPYVDFVVGRTEYDSETGLLTIAPVNLAARNLTDVLAKALDTT